MSHFHNIKTRIKSFKENKSTMIRLTYFSILKLYLLFKFAFNNRYRSEVITKLVYNRELHQISTFTKANRYPYLFSVCKEYFKNQNESKILSFGCSTGEEVKSIRDNITNAKIYGVDINKYCLKKCKKNYSHEKNKFYNSLSRQFENLNDLDAIFCLAVFQRATNRNKHLIDNNLQYNFNKFEDQIIILDKKLKRGGLLFIDQCDFNFLETSLKDNYKPLHVANNRIQRDRPLFNKENIKISSTNNSYRIFQKIN